MRTFVFTINGRQTELAVRRIKLERGGKRIALETSDYRRLEGIRSPRYRELREACFIPAEPSWEGEIKNV